MLFNSIEFAIFLPVIFVIYWCLRDKKLIYQNVLIVAASYVFYGWWDWRFLSLIIFSTFVDYLIGIFLSKENNERIRKALLLISIFVNLGLLGFFKYYNFFLENFIDSFTFFGFSMGYEPLNIILPVGISFYTFQTLSYTIDIYRGKLKPTKDFISFAAFVSFFPQLVAGPIERASNLLPQFYKKRNLEYASLYDGIRQIIWGLFKKMVIADNCAVYANEIFANSNDYNGSTLLLGAIFFAFQIYGDFSGYSDIAIGTARLFGFNLTKNFSFPYFSRDIAEFWRRWHISLSTWFRDYLYIPLGGSKGTKSRKVRNIFIIFIVSGFWHGANWTFIVWGFLNALYFIPLMLLNKNRINTDDIAKGRLIPKLSEFIKIIITFLLTTIAWVFFRSENINSAFNYLSNMISTSLFQKPDVLPFDLLVFISILLLIEWTSRNKLYPLDFSNDSRNWVRYIRVCYVFLLVWCVILWGVRDNKEFIYFQF